MADITPPAAAPTAPVTPPVVATPATGEKPSAVPAAEVPNPDVEYRAEALARAKRSEAKVFAKEQELKAREASMAARLAELERKAKGFDELDRISKEDPLAYMDAAGIKFDALSKRYLEKTTGAGKTPQQIADETFERKMAERQKLDAEASAKRQAEEKAQSNAAAEAGTKRQLAEIFKKDADRFELSLDVGVDASVAKAFKLIIDYYGETQTLLDFDKACDAVEAKEESRQAELLTRSKKLKTILDKQSQSKLEAAKATKPQPLSGSKTRREEPRPADAASTSPSESKRTPLETLRRPKPFDSRRIAEELLAAKRAAADS